MDIINNYHQIITKILGEYSRLPYAHGNLERKFIVGEDHKNYLLLTVGYLKGKRVHGCVVHLEIINDKIWIHEDGLEDGIALDLVMAGIPKNKIVLGFHPPEVRHLTEFAVN
ncbi:MAG: XisI protein [Okeania sp. SIO2G4]|uniref:XisI protein n=1 Tax=unclassified Okeania TaxID=2634635 RepID=UPI0013B63984|nr:MULTISPECIES: XisI protein [unclassified Okeania]NEP06746.1 XisI protein [Okeania sp. SIO4D6]NEP43410.1 XisI protein [Okeania sp. SIO2H7]NEP74221.1 XisI protein [Okeania sp. SIO2G5]NEP95098.1 XisI protein [Okeania sp. SIO2F5]NEQ92913.1 XisI protein [Okeania sp. SIO2G4]